MQESNWLNSLFPGIRGRFSARRWRVRLTLWCAALCAGLLVVLFAKLADQALDLFFLLYGKFHWLPFLLSPLIGMTLVWVSRHHFSGIQGSGIPQVIAATRFAADNRPVDRLISPRIALGKIGVGVAVLAGGFSAGREGPSVQVAASVLQFFHRFLPYSRALRAQDLILAGGAAGIAAAFNTPLAGIIFAVEELGRKLEARTSGVLVSTIIIAGLVAIALQGNYSYFGVLHAGSIGVGVFVPVILGGVVCGLLGGSFSRMLLMPQLHPDFVLWRWRELQPVWFAGGCGLLIAILGWLGHGTSFGSGSAVTSQAIAGLIALPWYVVVLRFFATLITYCAGLPGGIFAPCLAIGAALGLNCAPAFGGVESHQIIAICMTGFLAAVTQSPITSAIIVMEMIDGHSMVISLMAVALIAKAVSSRISPELYHQLALGFMRGKARQAPARDAN